jgi:hypothetical protein
MIGLTIVLVSPSPQLDPRPGACDPRPAQFSPGDLPAESPKWACLEALCGEAQRRGITSEELVATWSGYCPAQTQERIELVQKWLEDHPAESQPPIGVPTAA